MYKNGKTTVLPSYLLFLVTLNRVISFINMGTAAFDKWAYGHFIFGVVSFWIFDHHNLSIVQNFWIANGLHLGTELVEHTKSPDGTIHESMSNHVVDIIVFLGGWLLAKNMQYRPGRTLISVLSVMAIVITIEGIQRELRPNECTWLGFPAAFMPQNEEGLCRFVTL